MLEKLLSLIVKPAYAQQTPEDIVGPIEPPRGVENYTAASGADIGLIFLISNLIRFFTLLAGLWIIINIILAGYQYITGGGKSEVHSKVKDKFTMSAIGFVLMIAAYAVAALVGLIFFGDPTYILSPTIDPIVAPVP